jgi:hypothetical protein
VIEKKPGRNLTAIAIVALVVMYVGSYMAIRFQSVQFPSPGGGLPPIFLGNLERAAFLANDLSTSVDSHRKVKLIGRIYFPLVKADRALTGRDVLVLRPGGSAYDVWDQ